MDFQRGVIRIVGDLLPVFLDSGIDSRRYSIDIVGIKRSMS